LIQDTDNLVREAREQKLGTGLWAVLNLVKELTSTPVSSELLEQLKPSSFVLKCFGSLDLPQNCLEQRALKNDLLNHWADWLCLPSSNLAAREIWRYLLPRSEDYFYYEHQFGAPPAWPQRIKISMSHLYYLLGLSARLAWELPRKNKSLTKAAP